VHPEFLPYHKFFSTTISNHWYTVLHITATMSLKQLLNITTDCLLLTIEVCSYNCHIEFVKVPFHGSSVVSSIAISSKYSRLTKSSALPPNEHQLQASCCLPLYVPKDYLQLSVFVLYARSSSCVSVHPEFLPYHKFFSTTDSNHWYTVPTLPRVPQHY
jgi:hypothetical protein